MSEFHRKFKQIEKENENNWTIASIEHVYNLAKHTDRNLIDIETLKDQVHLLIECVRHIADVLNANELCGDDTSITQISEFANKKPSW